MLLSLITALAVGAPPPTPRELVHWEQPDYPELIVTCLGEVEIFRDGTVALRSFGTNERQAYFARGLSMGRGGPAYIIQSKLTTGLADCRALASRVGHAVRRWRYAPSSKIQRQLLVFHHDPWDPDPVLVWEGLPPEAPLEARRCFVQVQVEVDGTLRDRQAVGCTGTAAAAVVRAVDTWQFAPQNEPRTRLVAVADRTALTLGLRKPENQWPRYGWARGKPCQVGAIVDEKGKPQFDRAAQCKSPAGSLRGWVKRKRFVRGLEPFSTVVAAYF